MQNLCYIIATTESCIAPVLTSNFRARKLLKKQIQIFYYLKQKFLASKSSRVRVEASLDTNEVTNFRYFYQKGNIEKNSILE